MKNSTARGGAASFDPDAVFSNEDSLSFFGSVFTEPDEDDVKLMEKVRGMLDFLPPVEADFVELYFFKRIKQTDIASIFGVSQPTVCYRLYRAIDRIKFLLILPKVDVEKMRADLSKFMSDPMDIDIMMHMYETTCQSESAKRLKVSQGLVRHRFIRSIKKMDSDESMQFYAEIFTMISENLNIMRDVRRLRRNNSRIDCVID
jgi:DNA-directed RNA polymerase specialized sigma24 family protein